MPSNSRDEAETALALVVSKSTRTYLQRVLDAVKAAITAGRYDQAQPVLALGVLMNWWTDSVGENVVESIRESWQAAFGATVSGATTPRADAMAFHLAAVRDRLSRSAIPEIPQGAFDEVRLSQSVSTLDGWGTDKQARDIAERLAWEPDKSYWKDQKALAESKIDDILDPLGKPGTAARTYAHQHDPAVQIWQTVRKTAVDKLNEDESDWQVRATRIARTEATSAWNSGSLAALADEGVTHKEWLATEDERTRESHRTADGQVVAMTKPFRVGQSLLMMPGDPAAPPWETVNCRCTVIGADAPAKKALTAALQDLGTVTERAMTGGRTDLALEAIRRQAQILGLQSFGRPGEDFSTNVCIMAIPSADSEVNNIGTEEEKHATLLYFGDIEKHEDPQRVEGSKQLFLNVLETAAAETQPFSAKVTGIEPLGHDEPEPAQVWLLDSPELHTLFNTIPEIDSEIQSMYDGADGTKYPEYKPHVTIGYGEQTPEAKGVKEIPFDRLSLWWGDEHIDIPLGQVTLNTDSLVASGWRDQLRIPSGNGDRSGRWTFTPWKHLDDLVGLLNVLGPDTEPETRQTVKEALRLLEPFDPSNTDPRNKDFQEAVSKVADLLETAKPTEDESLNDTLLQSAQGVREWADTDWTLLEENSDIGYEPPVAGGRATSKAVWDGPPPGDEPVNPDLKDKSSQDLIDELQRIKAHPVAPSPSARKKRAAYLKELNDRRDRDSMSPEDKKEAERLSTLKEMGFEKPTREEAEAARSYTKRIGDLPESEGGDDSDPVHFGATVDAVYENAVDLAVEKGYANRAGQRYGAKDPVRDNELDAWLDVEAARQLEGVLDGYGYDRDGKPYNHNNPPPPSDETQPNLTTTDYEGRVGDKSHITRTQNGTLPISAVANMPGAKGETPGEHRNKQGEAWEKFKQDIAENGIQRPIFITVDPGGQPVISEGNHRRDAALELGLDSVPVEIRYFGHAEQTHKGWETQQPSSNIILQHPEADVPSTATQDGNKYRITTPDGAVHQITSNKQMTHAIVRRNNDQAGGVGMDHYYVSLAGSEEKALREANVQKRHRSHIEVVPISTATTPLDAVLDKWVQLRGSGTLTPEERDLLAKAIIEQGVPAPTLYRGTNDDKTYKPGQVVDTGVVSASEDEGSALPYAENGDGTGTLFVIEGKPKAIDVQARAEEKAGYGEAEWVTAGPFEVVSVEEDIDGVNYVTVRPAEDPAHVALQGRVKQASTMAEIDAVLGEVLDDKSLPEEVRFPVEQIQWNFKQGYFAPSDPAVSSLRRATYDLGDDDPWKDTLLEVLEQTGFDKWPKIQKDLRYKTEARTNLINYRKDLSNLAPGTTPSVARKWFSGRFQAFREEAVDQTNKDVLPEDDPITQYGTAQLVQAEQALAANDYDAFAGALANLRELTKDRPQGDQWMNLFEYMDLSALSWKRYFKDDPKFESPKFDEISEALQDVSTTEDIQKIIDDMGKLEVESVQAGVKLPWVSSTLGSLNMFLRNRDAAKVQEYLDNIVLDLERADGGWKQLAPGFKAVSEWYAEAAAAEAQRAIDDLTAKHGTIPEEQRTPEAIIAEVGMFYATRTSGTSNCVLASTAYELRRRGLDVHPKRCEKGRNENMAQRTWFTFPSDTSAGIQPVGGLKGRQKKARYDITVQWIMDKHPPGSRGTITCDWKGLRYGHIWNWERHEDGTVTFWDPQPGTQITFESDYWERMTWNRVRVMRLDDLPLKPDVDVMTADPEYKEKITPEMRALGRMISEQKNLTRPLYDQLRKLDFWKEREKYQEIQARLRVITDRIRELKESPEAKALAALGNSYPILPPDKNRL
jgi:2'-5' RNA ligase